MPKSAKLFVENGCQTKVPITTKDGWSQSNLAHPRVDALRRVKRERSGRIKDAGNPAEGRLGWSKGLYVHDIKT